MTFVSRKGDQEALENLIRRFNRKVQQAGVLSLAKRKQYREKPTSKRLLRRAAIRKRLRREERLRKIYLGR